MKKFNYELLEKLVLEQVTLPDRRFYRHEDGTELSSVTTVLGRIPSKKAGLAKWRKKVGNREADIIMLTASRRGTIVHDALEKYLLGDPTYVDGIMPLFKDPIFQLQKVLDEKVDNIRGVELRLFSREMLLAGTADLICDYDGIKTVVDFKTSKRIKKVEHITDYFLQSTAYALMIRELFGIEIEQICILIYVDYEGVFPYIRKVKDFEETTRKIFEKLVKM